MIVKTDASKSKIINNSKLSSKLIYTKISLFSNFQRKGEKIVSKDIEISGPSGRAIPGQYTNFKTDLILLIIKNLSS